ncbi:ribosomal protein L4 domain-containing protein [Dendryphion nanum]|uniref:Large ribosomal subunit protein uL4m n=1 Tax=Dendryphion nanum TaxID=256645 RepID=A0A9P9E9Q5_9PLEO|nr:ribosomal protein L4 domain-containing protein [Dendryphion nanum]
MAATTRMSPSGMRSVTSQMSRMSTQHKVLSTSLSTSFARPITTSSSSKAAVSPKESPIVPFHDQQVHATIHHFPSFEPIYVKPFPAFHLALPIRHDILHRAVVFEGDNTRRGTASTKWRDEIRGSARKLRPQKGSGRARLGDRGSPMLNGGGVAFGPKPRDFSTELQRKVYDIAFRTALSYRYKSGQLLVVDNALEIASPSKELITEILHGSPWNLRGKGSLFITTEHRPFLATALAQTPRWGSAARWDEVDVKDLLKGPAIVIEKNALHNILTSHSSDLPAPKKPVKHQASLAPKELQRLLGWSEFRRLEIARLDEEIDSEQVLKLESKLYRSLARKILAQAGDEIPEQAEGLQQSALVLKAKSFEAQARLMDSHYKYSRQASEKEALAEAEEPDSATYANLMRESSLLRAQAAEHRMMKQECLAHVEFTKAELFELEFDDDEAYIAREEGEQLLAQANETRLAILDILAGEDFEAGSEEQVSQWRSMYARIEKQKDAFDARAEAIVEAEALAGTEELTAQAQSRR